MAAWADFPTEIRDLILYWICLMTIAEYPKFDEHWLRIKEEEFLRTISGEGSPGWDNMVNHPKSPACLSAFSIVLQTCRDFRDALERRIILESTSAVETIQYMQYQQVQAFVKDIGPRPPGIPHPCLLFTVSMLKEMAGDFWMNPKVINDCNLVPKLLSHIDNWREVVTLLPYLQAWLLKHARLIGRETRKSSYAVIVVQTGMHSNSVNTYRISLKKGSFKIRGEIMEAWSIDGDNTVGDQVMYGSDLSLLDDVKASPTDTWWLLRLHPIDLQAPWFMVKYYEEKGRRSCKIYVGPEAGYGYYWEPGVWNLARWRKDFN